MKHKGLDQDKLVAAFSRAIPRVLARDLVDEFLTIRRDVATNTLGRAAPGKFVETFVQILQWLDTGKYDPKAQIDDFLRALESKATSLDDGLRICAARLSRAMYSLRNKRNIAHKDQVDPNVYDLRLLLAAAQWILTELLRVTNKVSMQEAGQLIDQIQTPVGGLVEDFGGRRIVLKDLTIRDEALVLLHSYYPTPIPTNRITSSLDRRSSKAVRNVLRKLWRKKLLETGGKDDYRLSQRGFDEATAIVAKYVVNGR